MKLGDVLRKERERKKISLEEMASNLTISVDEYRGLEDGNSAMETWGPKLGQIAIKLKVPTASLISETGKSAQAKKAEGNCGRLIRAHREKCGLTEQALAAMIELSIADLISLEEGKSPLENYALLLLRFAELIDQPIFNLFYPAGLPFDQLQDYP